MLQKLLVGVSCATVVAVWHALFTMRLPPVPEWNPLWAYPERRVVAAYAFSLILALYAAWRAGARRFDSCIGGIGGCPHAPGASGNVATEDVAYLFASMGVSTGLDFDALMLLRDSMAQRWLTGETLHGNIWRAGLPKTMKEAA